MVLRCCLEVVAKSEAPRSMFISVNSMLCNTMRIIQYHFSRIIISHELNSKITLPHRVGITTIMSDDCNNIFLILLMKIYVSNMGAGITSPAMGIVWLVYW